MTSQTLLNTFDTLTTLSQGFILTKYVMKPRVHVTIFACLMEFVKRIGQLVGYKTQVSIKYASGVHLVGLDAHTICPS